MLDINLEVIRPEVYNELRSRAEVLAKRSEKRIREDTFPVEGQIYRGTSLAAVIFNLCTGNAFPSNNAMRGYAPYKHNSRTFLSPHMDEAVRYANWNQMEHVRVERFLGKYGIELPYPGGVVLEFVRGSFRYSAPGGTSGWQSGIVSQDPLHFHHLTKATREYLLSTLELSRDSETGKLLLSQ